MFVRRSVDVAAVFGCQYKDGSGVSIDFVDDPVRADAKRVLSLVVADQGFTRLRLIRKRFHRSDDAVKEDSIGA